MPEVILICVSVSIQFDMPTLLTGKCNHQLHTRSPFQPSQYLLELLRMHGETDLNDYL
jgi:hypothetical protein